MCQLRAVRTRKHRQWLAAAAHSSNSQHPNSLPMPLSRRLLLLLLLLPLLFLPFQETHQRNKVHERWLQKPRQLEAPLQPRTQVQELSGTLAAAAPWPSLLWCSVI